MAWLLRCIEGGTGRRHRSPEADSARTNFIRLEREPISERVNFWHQEVLRYQEGPALLRSAALKVQLIDLKEKEMSKGELTSVMQAVGGIDKLLNPKAKDEGNTLHLSSTLPQPAFR